MKKLLALFGLSTVALASASICYAGDLTNNINGLYDVNKLPNVEQPILCVKDSNGQFHPWKHGVTLNPNQISGNQYYFGASLRLGGCKDSDIYLGWLNVSGSKIECQAADNSHIQLTNYTIANE